ncbi:DUF2059 domain-containing protein [Salinarimonas soli]|uniref:DUF2059 domain-containing protein n=1 Tax=Salinarimonas soli TaxID=1638099 RepID=A0A5B2VFF6_9HYPH|nr:DUF2059 domain-containing protein [Salinarimonas soli]KAA2237029.1 DUF2059 domain-containing protein [Salinarimonas soli]
MIRRLTLLALALALPLLGAPAARAEGPVDAARVAAARELIGAMRAVDGVKEAMPMLAGSVRTMIVKANPQTEADIDEVIAVLHNAMVARVDELVDDIAPIYAEGFSLQELESMTAFYRSPAGAKLAALQPHMMQMTVAVGQRWGERIAAEIEAQVKASLRGKGHAI